MQYHIFGESHGPAIGVLLEDVPAGMRLDMELIARQMARRAPGSSPLATSRKESDRPQLMSGVLEHDGALLTTGAPLCAMIPNENTRSGDYDRLRAVPRPSHSDFAASVRYRGCNDIRGGGHFSGRLTAPLVFAGAIAEQILREQGIWLAAHISRIGAVIDHAEDFASPVMSALHAVREKPFPVFDDAQGEAMQAEILQAKEHLDSVGGSIRCYLCGMPAGIGNPDFGRNAEGIFAQHMFAIPGVHGISFGDAEQFPAMHGSEANDALRFDNGRVISKTNHAGGINGGITNGMPLVFTVALRPTPSIARAQESVNLQTGENERLEIKGRHDPCIVQRAVPVVESAAALAALQLLRDGGERT